jgi:hypothetical protein
VSYQQSRTEETLNHGCLYDVGINDGTVFRNVKYLGTKLYYGKPIMVFKTVSMDTIQDEITINPSYHSWTIEKGHFDEMDELTEEYVSVVSNEAVLEKE